MKKPTSIPLATTAILTLAEIKAALEAFDRGESNVFEALDAISAAVEVHQAALARDLRREPRRRDAA